jgi:Domain of unknown function (DUF4383)
MGKTVCKLLGLVLLIVGLLGFTKILNPLGAHVGPGYAPHNVVHIVSGVLALYFGFAGSLSSAKGFCLVFGLVYLALAICGIALGHPPDHMWNVGPLVLGNIDHAIHGVVGIGFLAGGLLSKNP